MLSEANILATDGSATAQAEMKEGQEVEALVEDKNGEEDWHKGTVKNVNEDGTYDVEFSVMVQIRDVNDPPRLQGDEKLGLKRYIREGARESTFLGCNPMGQWFSTIQTFG